MRIIEPRTVLFCLLLVLSGGSALADPIAVPFEFRPGQRALASEVNENFSVVEGGVNAAMTALDSNGVRVSALEESVATLLENQELALQRIADLEQTLESLINSVGSLELENFELESTVADLVEENAELAQFKDGILPYLDATTDQQGNPVIAFVGVNVHINNGDGASTFRDPNGLGNLILGFDSTASVYAAGQAAHCTDGDFLTETDCLAGGSVWGTLHRSGSHNLVIGDGHSYSSSSGFVHGDANIINGKSAAVMGGALNNASTFFSVVVGGQRNVVSGSGANGAIVGGNAGHNEGNSAVLVGGDGNLVTGAAGVAVAGSQNEVNGFAAAAIAGRENLAVELGSVIAGGRSNNTSGIRSAILGGEGNVAFVGAEAATITGGLRNTVQGDASTVSGGEGNSSVEEASSVSGGINRTSIGRGSWTGGDLSATN